MAPQRTPIGIRLTRRLKAMPSGCIEWTGVQNAYGYGTILSDDETRKKLVRTHRVAWVLANGPIPDSLSILHRCDNRLCCNVEHLFVGTQQDNVADCISKGRFKLPVVRRGSDNPSYRPIPTELRQEILALEGLPIRAIARRFNTTTGIINRVLKEGNHL